MALVMVAEDEGFFDREGVNVTIKEFTAGKFALQAFMGGSLDFCVSGEVPVILATLQGSELRVVTSVVRDTTNECRIIVRKDDSTSDGPEAYFKAGRRRLATSFGGGPEFFTHEFLRAYNIPLDSVELVSMAPQDMPAALRSGSVDGIAIFDPFAYIAEELMGDQAVTFEDEKVYSEFYVISASKQQFEEHPERIEAILRALNSAAKFMDSDPERSKEIVAKYTKLDPEVIEGVWPSFDFAAWLPQELLDVWGRQVDWAIEQGKVPSAVKRPDVRSIVDAEWLRRVRPEAVEFD